MVDFFFSIGKKDFNLEILGEFGKSNDFFIFWRVLYFIGRFGVVGVRFKGGGR